MLLSLHKNYALKNILSRFVKIQLKKNVNENKFYLIKI